jgi:hypothetical protein
MSEFSARDLSMNAHARLGADGKRILCGAIRQRAPDGTLRFCCGGEMGEVGTVRAEWTHDHGDGCEERMELEETLIVLPRDVAPQRNCSTWRRTKRPLFRCEKQLRLMCKGRRIKWVEKTETYWGGGGQRFSDFVLPVEVVCPRCKRVNLITDALLPR